MTIHEIRELTRDAKYKRAEEEKEQILNEKIIPAAQKGFYHCSVRADDVSKETMTKLEEEGFIITFHKNDSDGFYYAAPYYMIEW